MANNTRRDKWEDGKLERGEIEKNSNCKFCPLRLVGAEWVGERKERVRKYFATGGKSRGWRRKRKWRKQILALHSTEKGL